MSQTTHRRLNLLIAIMGDSYEKVKESEQVEAIRERARIIVEIEKQFPKSQRYHRFMHFLEEAESTRTDTPAWEGVTRRVTRAMEDTRVALADKQDKLQREMNSKLNLLEREVNSKLENEMNILSSKLENEMNTKFELLDSKLDTILMKLK